MAHNQERRWWSGTRTLCHSSPGTQLLPPFLIAPHDSPGCCAMNCCSWRRRSARCRLALPMARAGSACAPAAAHTAVAHCPKAAPSSAAVVGAGRPLRGASAASHRLAAVEGAERGCGRGW